MIEARRTPRQLPVYSYMDAEYFVDFRLKQLRETTNPHNFIDFMFICDEQMKAELRALRAEFSTPCFMEGLD